MAKFFKRRDDNSGKKKRKLSKKIQRKTVKKKRSIEIKTQRKVKIIYRVTDFAIITPGKEKIVSKDAIITEPISITYPCFTIGNKNTHHLIPGSRIDQLELPEGKGFVGNTTKIDIGEHNAWHHLFINLMPDEIITSLLHKGWRPKTEKQLQAWFVLFGMRNIKEVIQLIRAKWSIEYTQPHMYKKIIKLRTSRRMTMLYL